MNLLKLWIRTTKMRTREPRLFNVSHLAGMLSIAMGRICRDLTLCFMDHMENMRNRFKLHTESRIQRNHHHTGTSRMIETLALATKVFAANAIKFHTRICV